QHECEVLRLLEAAALSEVDLGVRAGNAVRIALEVDVGRRLQLPVQHDREMLRVVEVVALLARLGELQRSALCLLTRDLLELAGAVARELEQHDRLVSRAEVRARPREAEVAAG